MGIDVFNYSADARRGKEIVFLFLNLISIGTARAPSSGSPFCLHELGYSDFLNRLWIFCE